MNDDLNREGIDAGMKSMPRLTRSEIERIVRAYLSSSQPITDEEREAVLRLMSLNAWPRDKVQILLDLGRKLSGEQS